MKLLSKYMYSETCPSRPSLGLENHSLYHESYFNVFFIRPSQVNGGLMIQVVSIYNGCISCFAAIDGHFKHP